MRSTIILRSTHDDKNKNKIYKYCSLREEKCEDQTADHPAEQVDLNEQMDDDIFSPRNYGTRIEGPWVFGMCQKKHASWNG